MYIQTVMKATTAAKAKYSQHFLITLIYILLKSGRAHASKSMSIHAGYRRRVVRLKTVVSATTPIIPPLSNIGEAYCNS